MTPDITTKEDAIKRIEYLNNLKKKVLATYFTAPQDLLDLFSTECHKEHSYEPPHSAFFVQLKSTNKYFEALDADKRKPRKVEDSFRTARGEFLSDIDKERQRLSILFDIELYGSES